MNTVANYNFNGKKAIIRVDLNVPLNQEFQVTDDTRLRGALPTINKILADGGSVVLMSHLGRPKGEVQEKFSLKHVVGTLSELLGKPVQFADDCVGEETAAKVAALQAGEVLLLQNLRFHKAEKKGEEAFAKQLADLGCDVYVNDAFGTAHRAHASTTTIAQFFSAENRMFGLLMEKELTNAKAATEDPARPFTSILGGAKVSDKILLIEALLSKVDNIIIGGGMAFTFIKAMGGEIGNSLCEEDKLDLAKELLEKADANGVKIYLPTDAIIADAFSNEANIKTEAINSIPEGWMGLDIGPASRERFSMVVNKSKTIIWNGPMGVFEMENFAQGTNEVAHAVANATKENEAFSLIGGGDSVSAIKKCGLDDDVSYVSTGGGAMLELLEGKTLPAIAAMS